MLRGGRNAALIALAGLSGWPQGAEALTESVDLTGLRWIWTPVISGVGLNPNATIHMDLTPAKAAPNAWILVLAEAQLRRVAPLLALRSREEEQSRGGDDGPVQSSYLSSCWRSSLAEPVQAAFQVSGTKADRYFVGVLQAHHNSLQGVSGTVSFVNPGGEQLLVQQRHVPRVVLGLAWAFFAIAVFSFLTYALRRRYRSRLHMAMFGMVITKCLVLLLVWHDFHLVAVTGWYSIPRQITWQLLKQVQAFMELMIFYVIGLGWKVVRPYLRGPEWTFAASIGALSFFLGSLEILCDTVATCAGQSYLLTQFTVQSLCYLVVIVATNFNIFNLQRQISEALAAPETGTLYCKLQSYIFFRGFFIFFIIIPSVTNYLTFKVLTWDELWVNMFVREFSLWVVYAGIIWLFRPGSPTLNVFELAVVDGNNSGSDSEE
eukprot:gnl/TRDRNA2_/TRDRNA2_192464_c0_seq1.p1 gnl/TRDRNA2_/TRDRNA2_192464_c0~~gnl/TRDRNA2_/TRDRNA2_192464_c0_seq1.p1  ORF type:complete len:433 (+),score=78.72 gnl/TRDRNA2_/TRDRNA2_192464_c0_seq1:89-1387(+)